MNMKDRFSRYFPILWLLIALGLLIVFIFFLFELSLIPLPLFNIITGITGILLAVLLFSRYFFNIGRVLVYCCAFSAVLIFVKIHPLVTLTALVALCAFISFAEQMIRRRKTARHELPRA